MNNLILFGYKSSGKTYFGRLLSQELGCAFLDTDVLVEELYEKNFCERLGCRQIAMKVGEGGFRQLEGSAIDSLQGTVNAVIAVGGGAILDSKNCEILKKLGRLVYLEVEKEVIKQRIFKDGVPSFLDSCNPEKSFEAMYEARKLVYEGISSFKVSLQGKTERQILDGLKNRFSNPGIESIFH